MSKPQYEYRFVRLGEGAFGVKRIAKEQYQETIHQHGRDGWRLVQIFSPSTGIYGASQFFELIFERELLFARSESAPECRPIRG